MKRPGWPRRTLRTRIVATTLLVSALAMSAMVVTVVVTLNSITQHSVDSTLEARAGVLSTAIESSPAGPAEALRTPDEAIDDTTWLYGSSGQVLAGPSARPRVQQVADALGTASSPTTRRVRERAYLAVPVRISGPDPQAGVLVVSQSLEPYEANRTEIVIALVSLGLLVTAGVTGIAAWTVSRSLRPVEDMAARAVDWSEHVPDARFDQPGSEDEIAHLSRALNVLLDRVSGALRSEQLLTAELAHELRTPLAGIRGEAELALMKAPDAESAEHLERVVALVDAMSSTITTLLAVARGGERAGSWCTLGAALEGALGHLDADERLDVRVDADAGRVVLAVTTELAVRALSPLLDNAFRHARTRVTLSCTVADRSVAVHVSDDGRGVGLDPDSLFDAGARDPDSPGAGLGLALSRRLARTLGGQVDLTSPAAPTTFTLTLPRR